MSRTTCRPPTSGAKTREPARRAVATLALALLFGLAASEARAGIAFVKNIGTNANESSGRPDGPETRGIATVLRLHTATPPWAIPALSRLASEVSGMCRSMAGQRLPCGEGTAS